MAHPSERRAAGHTFPTRAVVLALVIGTVAGLAIAAGVGLCVSDDLSVTEYGARGDGVSDDSSAIQAAVDACGSGGGTVVFPSGTYAVSRPIKLPAGNTAPLVLSGYGATIRLQAEKPQFLIWNTRSSGLTFRHVAVQGFTVDAQGHHPASGSWSVVGFDCTWGATADTNIEDVTVRDVTTRNVPTMDNPQAYKAFNINVYSGGSARIEDVLVQGCRLEGGTAGVSLWGAGATSNVTMDRVFIRDCWHDTRLAFTRGGPSENYHIGQYAHVGRAEVTGCAGYNSGDVGVEINNTTSCLVSDCTMADSFYEAYFYTNYARPLAVGADAMVWRNCRASLDHSGPQGFGFVAYWLNGIPLGDISILGCSYTLAGSASGLGHAALDTEDPSTRLRSLTVDGLSISDPLGIPLSSLVHPVVAAGTVSLRNVTVNGVRIH